jgi:outer membrane protein TolC
MPGHHARPIKAPLCRARTTPQSCRRQCGGATGTTRVAAASVQALDAGRSKRNRRGLALARSQRHRHAHRRLARVLARGPSQANRARTRCGTHASGSIRITTYNPTERRQTAMKTRQNLTLLTSVITTAWLVSGCASTNPEATFTPVAQAVRERTGHTAAWPRDAQAQASVDAQVSQWLTQPLTADRAVALALLNNAGLQAGLASLGIAQADIAQATRLPNPGFGFGRVREGDEREIERGWSLGLSRLISMPYVRSIAAANLKQVQIDVTLQALSLASQTRQAWVRAVHAQESLRYANQVMEATEASAELAHRMQRVGNFNKLQQAREQAFYADAALNAARAQSMVMSSREQLARSLGVWGPQTAFTLPDRLPDLPASADERPTIEAMAIAQRLDVQGAKAHAEAMARSLGLTRAQGFVNVFNLGLTHHTTGGQNDAKRGWSLSLELPLFDWGDARVARAQAVYMQAVHHTADLAVQARSQAREAYGAYRSSYDIAKHHREAIVPLKQRIADESLLRYNGMIIGVFELLADARAQVASVVGAIDALRDFWLAQADLDRALVGQPMRTGMATPPATSAMPPPASSGASADVH